MDVCALNNTGRGQIDCCLMGSATSVSQSFFCAPFQNNEKGAFCLCSCNLQFALGMKNKKGMAGREKNCKWYFSDQPNGQEVGPNNAMEQSFRNHPYASLVRESIQNSLDAVLDKSEPVVVKFSFMEMQGVDYPEFFELQHHIKGCIDYFPNNKNAKATYGPMCKLFEGNKYRDHLGFIRVSDYNTKGMTYEEGNTDTPFYAFVRSAGVTVKDSDSAGGSFGFGKAAYYLLSPINTIIVSTCTEDYKKYFEGAASLCTHTYKGTKKMAFGYYDDNNGKPITYEENIPAKFRRTEPGTDINILGFDISDKEEASAEMIEAVLRNFWMAIYNGKLVVEIDDDVEIRQDNIAELMESYFEDTDDTTRKTGYYNPRPYFDAVRLTNTSDKYVFFEDNLPLLGHVCLYLFKKKGAIDKVAYIRSLQMLVYSKRTRTNYGLYGVFYCDSEKGNDLLRNMENPAHDEWKAANWRINGKTCPTGRFALQEMEDFIAESMANTSSQSNKQTIDIKGLEDFLYIPTAYDEDDDLELESQTGDPTGSIQDDGTSLTTDIPDEEDNPTINEQTNSPSTGHVMINKTTTATNTTGGDLRSGHGKADHKTKNKGIQKPGDANDSRTEDKDGERGLFASPINIPYRSFSQNENNNIYHYVVLHSDNEIGNIRLHFYAAGEDNDEELQIAESNIGNISGNIIRDVHLKEGRLQLRVRFTDNMKHAIKLTAEELYEI